MLSEDAIENLIQPIVDRQEKINMFVIGKIADRVKEVGELLPSDLHTFDRLLKTGSDMRQIKKELAKQSKLQVRDINNLITYVAADSYKDTKKMYDYKGVKYIPFAKNIELQRVVKSIAKQTVETYINISKAQAFMIRDLSNPKRLINTPIAKAYQTVLDEAIQAAQGGIIDYSSAMRRTMQQLVDSGLRRVVYQVESGRVHTQRLDTAVRRNLLDGIRAINQGVQDVTGEQFGADGKEITVHANPAPDHAHIQGHQLTLEEYEKMQAGQDFKDYQGRVFKGFDRAIGTLNCRHFSYSIILGITQPNYTQEQLDKINENNQKGYTLPNDKHLTMYECTQRQRELETALRYLKEKRKAFEQSGDTDMVEKYTAKIQQKNEEYKAFSKSCGLKPRFDKTRIM